MKRPTQLALCRACQQFVMPEEITCPHCSANVLAAALDYAVRQEAAAKAAADLEALLARMGLPLVR
jgi:hypothetical protein